MPFNTFPQASNPNPNPNQVNHAILKWYADGMEQRSPPHQDKAEDVDGATADKCDMERDAAFYVFSFHDSSTFEFYLQRGRGVPNSIKKDAQLLEKDIVWKKALASGSLLKVSAKDNRKYFHALHKTKAHPEARCCRRSVGSVGGLEGRRR